MKTALVLLDFINDIAHRDGKVAASAGEVARRGVIPAANVALAHARLADWTPIFVKVGFAAGYPDLPATSPLFGRAAEFGALDLTSWGCALHPDLDYQAGEAVIEKPRVSAFYATRLEAILRARRIERLVICGISTAWAVESAVRDAHDRDYVTAVIEDACAAGSEDEHLASIKLLSRIATIVTSAQLGSL